MLKFAQSLSIFILLGVPLSVFLLQALLGQLGPDPAKVTMLNLGHAAISLLLLVLSLPLLAKLPRFGFIKRYSRMVGLWAFAYVSLHFLSYLAVVTGFQWQILLQDLEVAAPNRKTYNLFRLKGGVAD